MKRKPWKYDDCTISPVQDKTPRYFGNSYFAGRVMNRRLYWKVMFPDKTWIYCADKGDCRAYINQVGYRHGAKDTQWQKAKNQTNPPDTTIQNVICLL